MRCLTLYGLRNLSWLVVHLKRVVAILLLVTIGYQIGLRSLWCPDSPVMSCSSAVTDERCVVATYSIISTDARTEVDGSTTKTVVDGRSFSFDPDFLNAEGFPLVFNDNLKTQRRTAIDDIVFVTAANDQFFAGDLDAIALVQRHFPKQPIIFYDLSSVPSRSTAIKLSRLCNVQYRKFDFCRYPPHVRQLETYAFKPLIIHDVLQSHEVVFWLDSSIHFHASDLDVALRGADMNGGIALFDSTFHSIFAATHPGMYDYLPLNRTTAINTVMFGAGVMLVYRNREIYDAVIRWWYLCALTLQCIAPTTYRHCRFSKIDKAATYANCHRADQSALNVLLANHFSGSRIGLATSRSTNDSASTATEFTCQKSAERLTDCYVFQGPLAVVRLRHGEHKLSVCTV